jgi:putative DNA-invertase from lambdoid prophage Rac
MATYGYVRVSTSRQADEGESLALQERQITGYCLMNGMVLDHVYVEGGVSGSVPLSDRERGAALLAILKPGDAVVTAKLDRMFRSALDALDVLAKLKARNVSLHMIDLGGDVTGNGISKLVFTILSAVAEAERDRIRERVTSMKQDQKRRGRYLGGIKPWHCDVGEDGALVPVAERVAAIGDMQGMRAAGASLRAIASAMTAKGFSLSHEGVSCVLGRADVPMAA